MAVPTSGTRSVGTRLHDLVASYQGADASVAHLLCDRHPADATAYTIVAPDGSAVDLTYGRLREMSERFAAALAGLGVRPGDRVATLMGKSVEYLAALLGIWRAGAVHVPLFTAFATPAVVLRLTGSDTKVVVCDEAQRGKLAGTDGPWRVVVAGGETPQNGDLDFAELVAAQQTGFPAAALGADAPLIHIYTSGTTGEPKGVVVPTAAIAAFHAYLEFGLHVRADDVHWCAADPGWAYGLYYGIVGPLAVGVHSVLLGGGFSAPLTWSVLADHRVTNFAAAPTVYRALRASGVSVPDDLYLHHASSAGEPLTPDINEWAPDAIGVPVHDHYGQTETGMVINNHHHPALRHPRKPGSMGRAMPGWTVAVLLPDADHIAPTGTQGRIAVDTTASPLAWFTGYTGDPVRTAEKFTDDGRWYLTGDVGSTDEDGNFHFTSRDDDVVIMAGYRIGPFEVEAVLVTHPAVAECAVIGAPDALRGEVLEAYVVLADGGAGSAELATNIQQWVKANYAAHAYPRVVHFVADLPRTPSGKVQRFVLRQRRRKG